MSISLSRRMIILLMNDNDGSSERQVSSRLWREWCLASYPRVNTNNDNEDTAIGVFLTEVKII